LKITELAFPIIKFTPAFSASKNWKAVPVVVPASPVALLKLTYPAGFVVYIVTFIVTIPPVFM
jgi:hypothetical protein